MTRQKGFQESAPLGCVFEDTPGVGSIAAALGGKTIECVQKLLTVVCGHVVFDGHQHRSRIVFDMTDDRGAGQCSEGARSIPPDCCNRQRRIMGSQPECTPLR